MSFFHQHIDTLVGAFLILCSLSILIFPPKFGNKFYGITTKWTIKNERVWASGQKLFAISVIIIGLTFCVIGNLKIREEIPSPTKFFILVALWMTSKYFVHKILQKKYSNS